MKKIVFILALAMGLSTAYAGTVSWTMWDTSSTKGDMLVYLFEGDLTTGSSIASITDAASASTYVAAAETGASGVMAAAGYHFASGSLTTDRAAGDYNFYAVVFDAGTIADASGYQVFGTYSASVPASGTASLQISLEGLTSSGYISFETTGGGGGSIPEPTSGLLLLIGGSLLALRRKQK